jgi:MFS family permease
MLAFSFSSSITSALGGLIISITGDYRRVIWGAWTLFTVGYGLMTQLEDTSSIAKRVVYPLIAGIGLGPLFQVPMVALQAAMPIKDMATSVATYSFLRTMGSTVGVSIGQTIYTADLRKRLRNIENLTFDTSPDGLAQSVPMLKHIQDPTQRQELIHAYSKSISTIWIVCTPIVGVGLILSLCLRKYTFQQETRRNGEIKDEEKAQEDATGQNTNEPTVASSANTTASVGQESENAGEKDEDNANARANHETLEK